MVRSTLTDQTRTSQQRSSRNGTKIDTFLIHHQASTDDNGTIDLMVSGRKQVSANYTISNEGRLTSVVPEEYRAWTSGSSTDGGKGAAWDRRAITVEIENSSGDPDWHISDAAISTAARLLQDLRKRYTITHVLGHRDLWNTYRASYATFCPGPETVARIVAKAGGTIAKPSTPKPAAKPKPTVAQGKALQTLAAEHGYTGPIDGDLGEASWTGLQKFLKAYGYTGPADGEPGEATYSALQRFAAKGGGYDGPVDGVPGTATWAGAAKAAKAETAEPVKAPAKPATAKPVESKPAPAKPAEDDSLAEARKRASKALQTWARRGGYHGPIDGVLGENSWRGIQTLLAKSYGYRGAIDGEPGTLTYQALQRLAKKGGYTGPADGVLGVKSWTGVAKALGA